MTKAEASRIIKAAEAIKGGYAPYHKMIAFEVGFDSYINNWMDRDYVGVERQAYDRGYECAMRVMREQHND